MSLNSPRETLFRQRVGLPRAPGQWWEICFVLIADRCFKWGGIDFTVRYHVGRRCGVRPSISTYLWSLVATHVHCREPDPFCRAPWEGLPRHSGGGREGVRWGGGEEKQHTKEEEERAKKELAERWGEGRSSGGRGKGFQSLEVWFEVWEVPSPKGRSGQREAPITRARGWGS